jgi:ketosteroid isomerase-like protein
MRSSLISLIVVSAAAVATPSLAAPAAYEEAAHVVDAFHAALDKGDRDAALATLDNTVAIYEQGWVESSRDAYAKEHLGADLTFAQGTKSEQISRSGTLLGDLAYVVTEGRTTGNFEGKPVNSITLETMVLRRDGEGWRIVHIHWSSRKPK